jgi:hypothetical protein
LFAELLMEAQRNKITQEAFRKFVVVPGLGDSSIAQDGLGAELDNSAFKVQWTPPAS